MHFRILSTCRLKSLDGVVGFSIWNRFGVFVLDVLVRLVSELFVRRVFACNENFIHFVYLLAKT